MLYDSETQDLKTVPSVPISSIPLVLPPPLFGVSVVYANFEKTTGEPPFQVMI
jgi:hypothetical protein